MITAASPCAYCGTTQYHRRCQTRDYVSGELFEIGACSRCGLVRTMDQESGFDAHSYYDAAYYGQNGRRFPPLMERAILSFRRQRARYIQSLHRAPGRILDIGCGRGWMLADLQRRGWECVGTEVEPGLAAAIETEHGFPVHVTADFQGMFPSASFDVITLWHVLEHTDAPIKLLREVHRLLKPAGYVVVETPNIDSLQSRLGGGRWFHLDAPRHRYHFSASGLANILAEQGFSVTRGASLSFEFGFYGIYQTLLNFFTREPNFLFAALKRKPTSRTSRAPRPRTMDGVLTMLVLPIAIVFGTLMELTAAALGSGGVVRLTAVRRDVAAR